METYNLNKRLSKKIDSKICKVATDLDKLFKSYNVVLRITIGEDSCMSNNAYPYLKKILNNIRFRYEFGALKNEIVNNLLLLEKEEKKKNEELCRKYILLNGYNPNIYYYDVESDMFIKYDSICGVNNKDEWLKIAEKQEAELEEEFVAEMAEKIENIFSA